MENIIYNKKDIFGVKVNLLTILKEVEPKDTKIKRRTVECVCECGNKTKVFIHSLFNGDIKSCGCLVKNNGSKSTRPIINNEHKRIINCYYAMKTRCYNKNAKSYSTYGLRGIKVCDSWNDNKYGFLNFYIWSINNNYKENLTLDRIDNDKGYCPENCRWADTYTQAANKRRRKNKNIGIFKYYNGFCAVIMHKGERIFHKCYKTEIEAVNERNKFIKENNLPHTLN